MRDRRFIAQHRGGPLTLTKHRQLAAWAADCAEHVLPLFEAVSDDPAPRTAIELGRAWSRGAIKTGAAMNAAVACHAAARSVKDNAAIAAARAAGQAVATAHFAEHSLGPVVYGLKAVAAAGKSVDRERAWQIKRVPRGLKTLVTSALAGERFRRVLPQA
jgi:hypothetical protein